MESEGPHSTALSTVIAHQNKNTFYRRFSIQVEISEFSRKKKKKKKQKKTLNLVCHNVLCTLFFSFFRFITLSFTDIRRQELLTKWIAALYLDEFCFVSDVHVIYFRWKVRENSATLGEID